MQFSLRQQHFCNQSFLLHEEVKWTKLTIKWNLQPTIDLQSLRLTWLSVDGNEDTTWSRVKNYLIAGKLSLKSNSNNINWTQSHIATPAMIVIGGGKIFVSGVAHFGLITPQASELLGFSSLFFPGFNSTENSSGSWISMLKSSNQFGLIGHVIFLSKHCYSTLKQIIEPDSAFLNSPKCRAH